MASSRNLADLVADSFERELVEAVREKVTDRIVAQFREEVEQIVVEETEKLVVGSLESFYDVQQMAEKLLVRMQWDKIDTPFETSHPLGNKQ